MTVTNPPLLTVRHRPWADHLTRPAMANNVDRSGRLALTNRFVERDGSPVILITGELHYSRVPRAQWDERLRLMRAGGVTAVASYILWNHHQPRAGVEPSFGGHLDVGAFVCAAADAGLDVVLRIGPWAHAEARNGGFPDWVQRAPVVHRTDDPGYLALVDRWFSALGAQVAPLCGPGSNVIAVQLENELYEQPGHLVTLKRMATEHGIVAPIWTATAWGGAGLPEGEVLPLYGGYGDGFWVDADRPWDTTFREHFFFSHTWDDPGIGADLREQPGIGQLSMEAPRLPSPFFPAATCELGGGMATAYHRRPLLSGADIAAVAHNKIGNGSGWQGYYMYAGGMNPAPGLQESHATGYPNDLPEFDYDFHAPIGAAGRLGPAHAALRRQHAFLDAFGPGLAPMPSSLPDARPSGVDDVSILRWALRSDGCAGWVFVTWQQPHVPLEAVRGVRFEIGLDDRSTVLPHDPVDVPPGTIAHWPVHLELDGVTIDWLTASPLTMLDGDGHRTLVAVAEEGIPVELATSATVTVDAAARRPAPGIVRAQVDRPLRMHLTSVAESRAAGARLDVLLLPAAMADEVWVLGASGRRRLLVAGDPGDAVFEDAEGRASVRAARAPVLAEYDAASRAFTPLALSIADDGAPNGGPIALEPRAAVPGITPVPSSFGTRQRRGSAPSREQIARHAAAWTLEIPVQGASRRLLEIDWAGDVAQLELDGVVIADRFWDGTMWTVALDDLGIRAATRMTLRILPLPEAASVHLPAVAAARRATNQGELLSLDAVRLVEVPLWREA